MNTHHCKAKVALIILIFSLSISPVSAQDTSTQKFILLISTFLVFAISISVLIVAKLTKDIVEQFQKSKQQNFERDYDKYFKNLNSDQIEIFLKNKELGRKTETVERTLAIAGLCFILSTTISFGQQPVISEGSLLSQTGIIITIVLISIPVVCGIFLLMFKIMKALRAFRNTQTLSEAEYLTAYLKSLENESLEVSLKIRKQQLDYQLSNNELMGANPASDEKGLIGNIHDASLPFVARKKNALVRPKIDADLTRLVLWYVRCATFWLVFGTSVGEFVGIKFVAPDIDHVSWLSFGRLRPVHTNAVFWGWASLAMLGLGHYVVPRVSNTKLFSINLGWYSLILINTAVFAGTICLMAGINNGGGEYREYIWPVMLLFGVGLALTLINFLKTLARRTTKEIYISNWYIISAIIFAIVISIVAYVPIWQNGLGETIVQGYYMHQGVGMWFMLFTLGIVYYFLPQQLNKPIYSYSLGILAFWTQILFYTLIGTHHFVFSSIPWWLQTIAIVGSVGMVIPVIAGTTNFTMTFRGSWYKIPDSYTLPFFLTGIVFYFTGSLQGTAEAFRTTNLLWHFTDFTVAHSHITMYGIICFLVWAGIYAVVPRLTGIEPPQVTVGAHFWLALIGLMFYTIPLMYGSTLRGLMWMEGKPFIDSVVFMAPFWLWRAIGGSLMWLSHLFFAYNFYKMLVGSGIVDVREAAFAKLARENTLN
ncbi:cytochrome c oxidase cbb3-type subunit 1 [Dyadobacter koreensis]|uniref:Cytochrome c oxidase cbb3-type subunit 1 n=1 Tax=Dyadobacter koreensis TaxID=408657 RepID=A0A1H6UKC0_9BACT|nr:cbb3-type cytochrome c oxidase subunit I [Dyadobacter koreensis]SEI92783.1 cytochrome c oxidase cbb3-type subunit 1 [Dyadobacter koreensis]